MKVDHILKISLSYVTYERTHKNIFAESQNHRMIGAGRDLWGSSSPNPCQSRVT